VESWNFQKLPSCSLTHTIQRIAIFTLLKTKSKEELIEYVRLVANPLDACFDLAFHFFEESKNRETEWKEDVQRLDLLLKGILLYFKNGIKINTSNYNNALVKVTSLQDAARLRGEWKYSLHISTLLLEHYRAFKILHLEIEELFFPNILLQLDLLIKTYSSSEKEALYIYKHLEKELDAFYETLSYSEMLKILTIMTPLAIEQTIREAVKGLINYYLSDMSEDESVINDYHDAFLLIQYLIIRAYESDDELARYEAFYSYSPLITKYAIERAIEEGRYIQALHLAQNAEENAPTTLSSKKWRDMTLEIEKKMGLGDEEWLKNIKEALFTYNDIEFFIRLKNQTEKEKWDTEVDSILSTLYEKTKGEKSFTDSHKLIGSIYIEENRMNDLLILTQKHRGAITFYYKHLYIDYPKEVHEILEFFIFKIASGKANNISYQKVMMLLDMLIEANGKHLAFSFVQRLRNAYKSRRNLMDLLKKYDEVDTSPTLF